MNEFGFFQTPSNAFCPTLTSVYSLLKARYIETEKVQDVKIKILIRFTYNTPKLHFHRETHKIKDTQKNSFSRKVTRFKVMKIARRSGPSKRFARFRGLKLVLLCITVCVLVFVSPQSRERKTACMTIFQVNFHNTIFSNSQDRKNVFENVLIRRTYSQRI